MKIGYVRVSSVDQNLDRQLVTMEKYNVEKVFEEKVSAKDTNRPQLQEMFKLINSLYDYKKSMNELFDKDGNKVTILTLVIHDFSRLARSTKDLLSIVEYLESKQVALISAKESIDSSTPTGKLMLTMIGAINEFERANLLERQREGIAEAKKQGKYKGRKEVKIDKGVWEELYHKYFNRQINKTQFAKELGVSRPTLDKLLEQHKGDIKC
jgi:DNA invertase Pin-like site-specific DNA recombinase